MKVALTCIAKWEDNYMEEWLLYNRKIGFDHIYIYENDWRCKLDFPWITKIPWDGQKMQVKAYNDFIKNHNNDYDWVAFFDCDEFIVLKKHSNIKEFLADYDNPNGLMINWQYYGANGQLDRGRHPNSLLKQFTLREKEINHHIKTIFKLPAKGRMNHPHCGTIPCMDTNGKYARSPFNEDLVGDVAVLNHYCVKSFEDWKLRCERGRAPLVNAHSRLGEWEKIKFRDCEIKDLTALNYMYGK
jgi:hypothetical protein